MIGLILWAILIIFIAECACPGLIWVILGTMAKPIFKMPLLHGTIMMMTFLISVSSASKN